MFQKVTLFLVCIFAALMCAYCMYEYILFAAYCFYFEFTKERLVISLQYTYSHMYSHSVCKDCVLL